MENLRQTAYFLLGVAPLGIVLLLFGIPLILLTGLINQALFFQLELADSIPD